MKTVKTIQRTKQTYSDHQLYPGIYCKCPECKSGDVVYGMVSCPDDRYGCCVAHYGYGCQNCKAVFEATFEKDEYDAIQSGPVIISEEIGIAIVNPRGIARMTIKKDDK